MAMKKTYYSLNGEIIGERTPAFGRVDYLTDALGSVTATMNQSAGIVNTYRYKPYGGLLAKTGVGTDPEFTWAGAQGYRQTSKKYSEVYAWARHDDTNDGTWTSSYSDCFEENCYSLYGANVITELDGFPVMDAVLVLALPNRSKVKPKPGRKAPKPKKPKPPPWPVLNPPTDKNRQMPPDCTAEGTGCKAVWFTCNPNKIGKRLAVYCLPDDNCINQIYVIGKGKKRHRVKKGTPGSHLVDCVQPCSEVCDEYGGSLGTPVFERGSKVCIHGSRSDITRKIDDCGCGQRIENKPSPDDWMDWEGPDCKGVDDGWRCVCPGPCLPKPR
jgi:hypothetical protein